MADAVEPLVELLREKQHSSAAALSAVALRNLARNCPSNQDAIREAGGILALVALLSSNSATSQEAAQALRCIVRNNVTNREALHKAGGVTPLLTLLRADPSAQNTNAAMVLCNLVNLGGSQPDTSTEANEIQELDNLLEMDSGADTETSLVTCEPPYFAHSSRNTSPTMRGSASPIRDASPDHVKHDAMAVAPSVSLPEPAQHASGILGGMGHNPTRVPMLTGCWAVLLCGSDEGCDMSFRVVGSHLQEKFCSHCRANGILVPRNKVRALPPALCAAVTNGKSEGFWTDGAHLQLASGGYRLINHTQGCEGPRLVILESERDATEESGLDWPMLPAAWIDSDERIRLWISRGTLVPRKPRKSFCPSAEGSTSTSSTKRQRASSAGSKNERQVAAVPPATDLRQPLSIPISAPMPSCESSTAMRYQALLAARRDQHQAPARAYENSPAAKLYDPALSAFTPTPTTYVPSTLPTADGLALATTIQLPSGLPAQMQPSLQDGVQQYNPNVFRSQLVTPLGPYALA